MIKLTIPIIVEGKYDKILINSIFDCTVIETRGFAVFNDERKIELIKKATGDGFLAVLTDSDSAGQQIRTYIKSKIGINKIINVYIPQIAGKERRKTAPSRSGYLGVEGMNKSVILQCFAKSGILLENNGIYYENTRYCAVKKCEISKKDLYFLGLYGGASSSRIRARILQELELDTALPVNTFIEIIEREYTLPQLKNVIKRIGENREG